MIDPKRSPLSVKDLPLGMLVAVFMASCSAVQVDSNYDKSANFARFRTFRWVEAPPVGVGDPRVDDTVLQARVKMAVNRELEAKGLKRVDSGDADLLVNYFVTVEEKMTGENVNDKYGYSPGSNWSQGERQGWSWGLGADDTLSVPATYYEEGSVIIDMVDPTTKRLIWRGSARTVVDLDSDDETRRARLNEAVARVFEQYPPK